MVYGMSAAQIFLTLVIYGFFLAVPVVIVVAAVLLVRRLLAERRLAAKPELARSRKSLAQVLRAHREEAHMTQELVAQHMGVSRQAVSKWESGATEPSTTNLMELARLYGTTAADLLREVEGWAP